MNYSRRHVIILFVLLFAGCTAHAAIPALLVADATFAPVDLLPGDMQVAATEIEHPVTIEGIELVHARTLANRADMRIYGNTSSGTAFIKTSAGPMHLRTLSTLDFWQDPAIRARTDYTPHTETVTCQRIVDGDTIKLAHGRRLRYIGVDTPETKHPNRPVEYYGKQASRFNK